MMCLNREGKSKCTWWITECVNPSVSAEIKKVCNGQIQRCETQDIGLKFHSYPPTTSSRDFAWPIEKQ